MTVPVIITYLVSFLSAAGLGAVVFYQNPKRQVNRLLAVLISTILGWQITLFFFYYISNPGSVLWLGRLNFVFAELIALALFIFCFFFSTKIYPNKNKQLYVLGFYTLLLVIFTFFSPLIIEEELVLDSMMRETVFGFLYPFFVLHFIALTLGGIIILFDKAKKLSGLEKQQTFYLLLGIFVAVIFGSITNIFLPLFFKNYSLQHAGLFSPIIFVAIAAYAIVKHRLFDIRALVARTISHSLLVLILGSLYSVVLFVVGSWLFNISSTPHSLLYSTTLALILAYTFQPLRQFLETITDSIFYKSGYDTQEVLKKLSKLLVSTYLVNDLLNDVLLELREKIKIQQLEIILFQENQIELQLARGQRDVPIELSAKDKRLLNFLKRCSNFNEIVFEDLQEGTLKEFFRRHNIKLIFPLKSKDNFIGFLLIGDKLSGDIYSEQDIRLFELFGPELSLAIQNAEAFDEISKFNITLKKKVAEATKDLQAANQQLQELDRLKDEFLSITSHELRTPLTAIRSYLWMVLAGKGGELKDKQKYYLERSYNSTERLIKLVNDMLNVSRIEAGNLILNAQPLDMKQLCLEVIDELKGRAEELELELTLQTAENDEENTEYLVAASPNKIKEVLINLVGNSLKFTPKGGSVSISLQKNDNHIITQVTDTGIGLNGQNKKSLFEKFGLVEGSYKVNQEASQGTGLGLYICKSIIDLHKGKIWAESAGKNKGSTFTFSLPIFSEETLETINKNNKSAQSADKQKDSTQNKN